MIIEIIVASTKILLFILGQAKRSFINYEIIPYQSFVLACSWNMLKIG